MVELNIDMRQVRITTQNLDFPQDNDCYLAPDDPIHQIRKASLLGGLGSQQPEMSAGRAELIDRFLNPLNPQYKNSISKRESNDNQA